MSVQYWSICSITLLTILITLWWLYTKTVFNYWRKKGVTFVPPVPIFGNVMDVFLVKESIGNFLQRLYKSTQVPYLGIFVMSEPFLLIRDLNVIKSVLVKDFNYFIDRTISDNHRDDPVTSNFLFTLKQPIWKESRRQVNPLFSSKKLKLMHQLIIDSATNWTKYLERLTNVDNVVDLRELCAKFTLDSIMSTAFCLKSKCYEEEDANFKVVTRSILDWKVFWAAFQASCYQLSPSLVKLFRLKLLDKQVTDFLSTMCLEAINNRKVSKEKRNDLIDILVEQMEAEDDIGKIQNQLVGVAGQFFVAGYETSTSTISFALYELAKHPDVQKRLRAELLKTKEKFDGFPYESLTTMPYLDMVMKESLRMYPILPYLDRKCVADYTLPGTDIVLAKGNGIYISTLGLHHDPEYYPEPERFDPLRFAPENVDSIPAFAFLPFGEGPRNCMGKRYGELTVKTALAHIISQYELKTCSKTQMEMELNTTAGLTIQPATGSIFVEFEKL